MSILTVCHFGPDPATVGGIASMIRILADNHVGADVVDFHPTWQPRSRLNTIRLTVTSTCALLHTSEAQIAHVHLSERGSFLREGALLALARRRGLVTVATIHGAVFTPFAHRYPWLVSKVLGHAHFITCLDQDALEAVQRCAPLIPCEIVPNPALFDDCYSPAYETDELVVFGGEISLRKGADILCAAWRLVAQRRPMARCLMVGPLTDFSPPVVERLQVRSPATPVEMRELLRSARVVALPARAEGMPMILTEAMSMGRPFVSTPVGGISELANAGGVVVPVGDEMALADRLTDLLSDPKLAHKIGEQGRTFCLKTRAIEIIDDRLRKIYSRALVEAGCDAAH